MKFWKIGLSAIIAFSIIILIMNVITSGSNINTNIMIITPSIFYTGVNIIVLSILMLCSVIIICTSNIIKAINNKNM
jgi:hypothetical protein